MAQFKVLERSFIGNKLVEAGAIVEIDTKKMKPGSNLEAVKGGAPASDKTEEKGGEGDK